MDQKPMDDTGPLKPPTAEVAKAYLEEVGAVELRREALIDRRAVGWLSILNAAVISLFLYLTIVGLRDDATFVTQSLLIAILIWGQLSTGVATRNGVQWQLTRRRWTTIVGLAVLGVVLVGSMFAAIFAAEHLDGAVVYVAPVIAFLAFTGIGVRQLWQARGHRPLRGRPRAPLSGSMRMATVALGLIIGGLTALLSVPESVLSASLVLLLLLVLLVWMFAGRVASFGLPMLGEMWRWPQFAVYGLSTVALFASASWALFGPVATIPFAAIAGGGVIVLFSVVAFIGGRDAR